MILILDYGSQTTQLIARRIREKRVYSEIVPFHADLSSYRNKARGIILSGGPSSVYAGQAPYFPKELLDWNIPMLGICYGAQLLVHAQGGKVQAATEREFGKAQMSMSVTDRLFDSVFEKQCLSVWMSHGDRIISLPEGFEVIAQSTNSPFAAIRNTAKKQYGVQFHPEVTHTQDGSVLLNNFVFQICQEEPNWKMENFIESQIMNIQSKVKKDKVICALSGGVDSSVVAVLLHKAIGKSLIAIFVDTGLLRKNEREQVEKNFKEIFSMDLHVVDARKLFLKGLQGVLNPEEKRKIIGRIFIEVFEKEARSIPGARYLAQGTLYPDVIESISFRGPSSKIKSHHNVGGLPEKMNLLLIEPLRELFKDEVRLLGKELGLPEPILARHPFPGPGLGVRILGEVTQERIEILQAADAIFIQELHKANLYTQIWQAFVVLLPIHTVGVMGDERTYEHVCSLRAVTSVDGMTADWFPFSASFLGTCANRIINEVRGINRVVYDISSKPPATIEWE